MAYDFTVDRLEQDLMAAGLTAQSLGLQDEEEVLDVLDLPQLYMRPSADSLLSTLSDLKSQPSSWGSTPRSGNSRPISGVSTPVRRPRKIRSEGVPAYLTKIVSSRLQWIEDEDEKEKIWQTASQELSARSGRTAQGDLTRSFIVSLDMTGEQEIDLTLHEPALTADNLGFKTWASSYMLAKRLCLLQPTLDTSAVLEIGSGTGLVGLAAACVFKAALIMTDLPEIVPNLERNIQANEPVILRCGGTATAAVLDWTQPGELLIDETLRPIRSFSLVLAADVVYSSEQPRLVAQTVAYHLARTSSARLVLELPLRDGFDDELVSVRQCLDDIGLIVEQDGQEDGLDDWAGSVDDEPAVVRCSWSIWRWTNETLAE